MKQEFKRIFTPERMARYKTLWMMGLPGVGKTFISRWICQQYPWFTHFCIGDLIRDQFTPSEANSGFAPQRFDSIIERWYNEAVSLKYEGLIVDSAPRNFDQIRWIARSLDPVIVFVKCPEENRKLRITQRAVQTERVGDYRPMPDEAHSLLAISDSAVRKYDINLLEVRN